MASFQKTLPPEIWSQILGGLPQLELQYLLDVCSQFHDIIIRHLFSSIKVYLIGGIEGMKMLNTFDDAWTQEKALKLMRKSWEILNRISQDPQFAKVVKHITVIAYIEGLGIFERLTVANIFSFLPNLQTFRWVGCNPAFDDELAQCLPSTLKRLDIQSGFPVDSLQHLHKLTALHLPIPFQFPDDDEAVDRLVEEPGLLEVCSTLLADNIVSILPSTLQSLRICASYLNSIPIRIYTNLRELEIFGTIGDEAEFTGLDAMFRHAVALESLSVVGYVHRNFFSFLPTSSAPNLVRLISFRLSLEALLPIQENDFCALATFLQGRTLLRRLYIRYPEIRLEQTARLLTVIRDLKGLEVLGVHLGSEMLMDRELGMVASVLTPNLRALHLAINWGGDSLIPLLDRIGSLPKLAFLHLYGIVIRLPISVEEVAKEAKGLDTIGLNRSLWSIERVGPEIFTTKWPRWKIKFCVKDEFVRSDDYWLFKYN